MTFRLRTYQEKMIDDTRAKFVAGRRAVIQQLPTGGGKTIQAVFMLGTASAKKHHAFFIVHRRELIDQCVAAFETVGLPFGIIGAGYTPYPAAPLQIASIQTLRHRLGKVQPPRFIVWDECHHIAAGGWSKVFAAYPEAYHVGLSATPSRLDGQGLDDHFDDMVIGPSVQELQAGGFLVPFRVFAPSLPDMTGVNTVAGDYNKAQLAAVMDNDQIMGDAVKHYKKHASGKRGLVFCASVKNSQKMAQKFREAGIVAVHVDGNTDRHERKAAMWAFRQGQIDVLTNVDLFGEGVDVPGVEVISQLRPTQSLTLFMQQCGRAARPAPDKTHAIILDHAGNVMRHGLPDEDRVWTLQGREKGKKRKEVEHAPIRQCEKCYHIHRIGPFCPNCGYVYPIQSREIEEVEGDLVEIDAKALRREQLREQGRANGLAGLIELEKERGYKEGWAQHIWNARQRKAAARINATLID